MLKPLGDFISMRKKKSANDTDCTKLVVKMLYWPKKLKRKVLNLVPNVIILGRLKDLKS